MNVLEQRFMEQVPVLLRDILRELHSLNTNLAAISAGNKDEN